MNTARSPVQDTDPRRTLLSGLPMVRERRIRLADISTVVLEGGDGPPVLLLHGPGESALWWMRVFPRLATTHRAVAPDLPGHGESGLIEGGGVPDTDGVLALLDELIEATCPTPPVLVGHLLGGAIAARFAAERGDRIDRLVLVDSFGLGPFRPSVRFALGLIQFAVRPSERTYGRFLPHCLYDLDELRERMGERWDPFIAYYIACARSSDGKDAMQAFMRQFGLRPIPREALERIEVPTTLIWGRHDRAIRLGIAEKASARYGWPLRVIEEARDDPKLERPEAFLEALRSAREAG